VGTSKGAFTKIKVDMTILEIYLMGPQLYMQFVVDPNVLMHE
jgi:hypothetical protein